MPAPTPPVSAIPGNHAVGRIGYRGEPKSERPAPTETSSKAVAASRGSKYGV